MACYKLLIMAFGKVEDLDSKILQYGPFNHVDYLQFHRLICHYKPQNWDQDVHPSVSSKLIFYLIHLRQNIKYIAWLLSMGYIRQITAYVCQIGEVKVSLDIILKSDIKS